MKIIDKNILIGLMMIILSGAVFAGYSGISNNQKPIINGNSHNIQINIMKNMKPVDVYGNRFLH